MALNRPKPSMLENLSEVGLNVCSYLDDRANREEVISIIENVKKSFNTWMHLFKSIYPTPKNYYNTRFKVIDEVLFDLKKVREEEVCHPNQNVEANNTAWLQLILKFFKDDLWDQENRPGVMVMRKVLNKFNAYDLTKPLPLNDPMEVLHKTFSAKALETVNQYIKTEKEKQELKLFLASLKIKKMEPESEVIKSYQAKPRKKFDYEHNEELKKLRDDLLKIYKPYTPENTPEPQSPAEVVRSPESIREPESSPKVVIQVPKVLAANAQSMLFSELTKHNRFKSDKGEKADPCVSIVKELFV